MKQLEPYFGFLASPIGPAIFLAVLSVFYFSGITGFCSSSGYNCMGSVTGTITFIVCIVELFMKKDATVAAAQATYGQAKQLGDEGK